MSPKFVDKELKVQEIALAALQLFSQKGYSSTSVGQIAAAAGIGKGTIYEYFKTKEDIFVAAIMEWSDQGELRYKEMMREIEEPIDQLYSFVDIGMKLFDPNDPDASRMFIEILQQTFMEGGAFYKKHHLVKEMTAKRFNVAVHILLNGVSKGVFKPEIAKDAEKIAINLISFLRGVGIHGLVTEKTIDTDVQIEFYLKTLLDSIKMNSGKQINKQLGE